MKGRSSLSRGLGLRWIWMWLCPSYLCFSCRLLVVGYLCSTFWLICPCICCRSLFYVIPWSQEETSGKRCSRASPYVYIYICVCIYNINHLMHCFKNRTEPADSTGNGQSPILFPELIKLHFKCMQLRLNQPVPGRTGEPN